jgi:hypothetical protein
MEVQSGQLEIFPAAPVKPSDVLLDKLLDVMPFYGIITVTSGFFTAVMNPLGLDMVQITILTLIFRKN